MSDRRRFPRIEMNVDVDVHVNNNNFFGGRTRDISMGGIFIESTTPMDIGSTVGLKVRFDGQAFHLTCRVAWSLSTPDGAPTGFGVEFVRLPLPARRAIEEYMSWRAPELFQTEAPQSRLKPPSTVPRPRKGPPPLPQMPPPMPKLPSQVPPAP